MEYSFQNKNDPKVLKKILHNGGFYGDNYEWNSIIQFNNDKHIYRHRVETIVVKDKSFVYVKRKDGKYFLPGGSTERCVSLRQQAINECQEEARLNIKNLWNSGYSYKEITGFPKWAQVLKIHAVQWDGKYSSIFVGEFDSIYDGEIEEYAEDNFINTGAWYSIDECMEFFRDEHKYALREYLEGMKKESLELEDFTSNQKHKKYNFGKVEDVLFLPHPKVNYRMKKPSEVIIFEKNKDYDFNYAVINKFDGTRETPYSVIVLESNRVCAVIDNNLEPRKNVLGVLSMQWFSTEAEAEHKWKTCVETIVKKPVDSPYFKERNKLKIDFDCYEQQFQTFIPFAISVMRTYLKKGLTFYTDTVELKSKKSKIFRMEVVYALPSKDRYLLKGANFRETKRNIKEVIKYFNSTRESAEDEKIMAENIFKAMESVKMSKNVIGERNRLRKYL